MVVEWEESRQYCLENCIFHQPVDEDTWDGLEYAMGYGFWCFLYGKKKFEDKAESLIYR